MIIKGSIAAFACNPGVAGNDCLGAYSTQTLIKLVDIDGCCQWSYFLDPLPCPVINKANCTVYASRHIVKCVEDGTTAVSCYVTVGIVLIRPAGRGRANSMCPARIGGKGYSFLGGEVSYLVVTVAQRSVRNALRRCQTA